VGGCQRSRSRRTGTHADWDQGRTIDAQSRMGSRAAGVLMSAMRAKQRENRRVVGPHRTRWGLVSGPTQPCIGPLLREPGPWLDRLWRARHTHWFSRYILTNSTRTC
jgi:hypothetical protein